MAKDTNRVISELHKGKYIPTQNMKRKKTNTHLDDQRMIRSLKNPAVTKPFPAEQAKSAKEEITALKQEMEFILGVTKTGLDIIDPQFNIRYIDPEWAKVYGDPTEKKCYEYFMDRNEVCPDCGIPVALKKKRVAVTEETLVKEGNRPIQVTTIPFQDGDGEWLVAEVNVDISERKRTEESLRKAHEELEIRVQERTAELARTNEAMQAEITERKPIEDALRESEERYRSFVENFQGIAYRGRMDFVPIFFHGAVEAITGYKEEEFLAGNPRWDQMIHPDDLSKIHESFQEIHSTPSYSAAREYRILRKDGKVQWVHEQIQNICDSSGKPMMVQGALYDITDRKRAEEALRRSEERYRTILEEMEEGYFETDLAGNLTFVNDAGCRNLGYPREELIGMNNRMYADEENAKKVFQALSKLYRTGEPCRVFDYETIKKDGTKAISELSASLMRDSEGKPIGFRGTSHHVTERKQMEEALREGEERYRTLLETMEEGYYEVDLTGNLTFINDSFSKMHARENMLGMNNRQYMSKEMARRVYEMFNGVYKTGQPVRLVEWEIIKGNGGKAVVEASVYLIKNAKGERIGFRGIERDITDRKRAEEALRRSEEKYRNILESIQDGYFEVDLAGNFTFVNDVICRHLRYARDELIGMNYRQYTDEENAKKLYQHYIGLYRTGQPIKPFEAGYVRKDGTKLLAEISVSLIRDSEGKPIGFRGISRDITERKQAEEEKLSLQEQLRQSQKMEAIGQLAGGVAHDFNNLLTVIKGYSQLSLLDLKENDSLRGNIQEIEKATQRATDLTRQLLAFSRRQILDLKVLDLNVLLTDLDKMLRRIIGEDIQLVTLLSEDLGKVKIDPSQIEQVIFNLAVNARDAMPSGGKLTIETANVELDEEYAHAHISVIPGRLCEALRQRYRGWDVTGGERKSL